MMRFNTLDPTLRRRLTVVAVALALLQSVIFQFAGTPLRTAAAPQGIISFEFARDLPTATAIVQSWRAAGGHALTLAGFNLGFDFLYPPLYAAAIGLCALTVAPNWLRRGYRLYRAADRLVWGLVGAAALDYVENVALVSLLLGSQAAWLPPLAYWCATIKFLVVFIALLYVTLGAVLGVFQSHFGPA